MFCIDPIGIAKGLCIFWKDTMDVNIINYDCFYIIAYLHDLSLNIDRVLIVVHLSFDN